MFIAMNRFKIKPGMEQHFLATRPTKARQRELKKRGYIDFDEAVPVKTTKSQSEKEE